MDGQFFQRRSGTLFWACFLPFLMLTLWAWWHYGLTRKDEEAPLLGRGGFDIPEAPKQDDTRGGLNSEGYTSRFELETKARLEASARPIGEGSSMLGSRSGEAPSSYEQAQRAKELAFIQKNGPLVRSEQKRMEGIIAKNAKKYPVINQFAEDYYKATRLTSLYQKYKKDGDFYSYVRSASALPESKDLIQKYVGRVDTWKAGFAMTAEVLRNPPPAVVYGEMLKVFTSDRIASKNTTSLMTPILANLPVMALQAATPASDMKLIQGLAGDVAGSAGAQDPKMQVVLSGSQNSNEYWRGYRDGYENALSKRGIKTAH